MSSEQVPFSRAAGVPQEEDVLHDGGDSFQRIRLPDDSVGNDSGVWEVEALSERETRGEGNSPWGAEVPACEGCPWMLAARRLKCERGYWQTMHAKAVEREKKLLAENAELQAQVKQLQKQLYGRKSEKRKTPVSGKEAPSSGRKRGQQHGKPGHGRRDHSHLPAVVEDYDLPGQEKCCPLCGKPKCPFPGTEDSELIEIEVQAYRRVIRRKRYKPGCECEDLPGIVTASGPGKLIPKGTLGVSVLNDLRLEAREDPETFAEQDRQLRAALEKMEEKRETELSQEDLPPARRAVLVSLREHWKGLTVFVDHPEVPMDNNEIERIERGPVVARKNYYGSGAEWSGHLAAAFFSIFATLKLWGLNPRLWLTQYLQVCADLHGKAPESIEPFLPWNMTEQERQALSWVPGSPVAPTPTAMDSS